MSDRGYVSLLSHLNRSTTALPLETIQASIAHYLAHVEPSPTPLAGIIVSSAFFRPVSLAKLEALPTAFRHAVHIKIRLLKEDEGSLFKRGLAARMGDWVYGILKGLQGGQAAVRLACCSGLLLGLEDWEEDLNVKDGRLRRRVEEELVVALAEVMEAYNYAREHSAGWEKEFKPDAQFDEGALSTAFLIASPSLLLVSPKRLQALSLPILASSLYATIDTAFQHGGFLSTLNRSFMRTSDGKIAIDPKSPFAENLQRLNSSPMIASMASLSRLCARALTVLADSRPREVWPAMSDIMQRLQTLTRTVETDWSSSPLACLQDEGAISSDTRELATALWNILKTLLFTAIMIVQAALSTVVFVPLPSSMSLNVSPYSLALTALHIFSHLAFVIPQFGGVASTSQGFPELKKVFYTALDILSSSPSESERFVRELSQSCTTEASTALPKHFLNAKRAYALACFEQLVPILTDELIREEIYPICSSHLYDPSHRETYESAHSVILSIFASHSQKANEIKVRSQSLEADSFAEQIVPFYVQCLLDNSHDGALSTTQLALAYAALVRSAGTSGANLGQVSTAGDALAWFCIESLLRAIRSATASSVAPPSTAGGEQHVHRLHLTLIATVPSVSLALLPKLLEEIATIIETQASGISDHRVEQSPAAVERHEELVQALYKEILENVGDAQKEFVIRWWHDNKDRFELRRAHTGARDSKGKDRADDNGNRELTSRL